MHRRTKTNPNPQRQIERQLKHKQRRPNSDPNKDNMTDTNRKTDMDIPVNKPTVREIYSQ